MYTAILDVVSVLSIINLKCAGKKLIMEKRLKLFYVVTAIAIVQMLVV